MGATVLVEMPAGNTVNGRITVVSSVATTSSAGNAGSANGANGNTSGGSGNGANSGSSPTVPVTIALTQAVRGAGLDQAAVSVQFAQAKATNVLSVPVSAFARDLRLSYALQEAPPPHGLIR